MHADGASRGNPGASGIGVVIEGGGKTREISEHIGTATNNVAEYSALVRGLEEARALGVEEITVYLDSELLVKQMTGAYRVRNPGLRPLYERAASLAGSFKKFSIRHVRRGQNARADDLAKRASAEPGGASRKKDPAKLF